MAVQVSYLAKGLYPSWFKTGPESVKSFGEMPTLKAGSVSSFGERPTLKAGSVKSQGEWINPKGEAVSSFRGRFPQTITPEEVTSKPFTLPVIPTDPPPDNPWMEIGQPYFHVYIESASGGTDLGLWVKLDGLAMKVNISEHRTGDGQNYRWIEPGTAEWPNIKLSRAATARGCQQTLAWLCDSQNKWTRGMTMGIVAKPMWYHTADSSHFKVDLVDIMPVGWSTNGFATDGKLAMEVLELAICGIVRPGPAGGPAPPTAPPPYDGRKEPTPAAPEPKRDQTAVFTDAPKSGTDFLASRDQNR